MPNGEDIPIGLTEDAEVEGQTRAVNPVVALARRIEYRGSVDHFDMLPAEGNEPGDCYAVRYKGESAAAGTTLDGSEYFWAYVDGSPRWLLLETETDGKANKVQDETGGHIPVLSANGDVASGELEKEEVVSYVENAVRQTGEYPDLTVGTADQIGSSVNVVSDDPYSFRSTAGGRDVMDTVAVTGSASGAVASFSDGAANKPVLGLTAEIAPVQDLHGYDSPWAPGAGKNKFLPHRGTHTTTANGITLSYSDADEGITIRGTNEKTDAAWLIINTNTLVLPTLESGKTYYFGHDLPSTGFYSQIIYNNTSSVRKSLAYRLGTGSFGCAAFTLPEDFGSLYGFQIGVLSTASTIPDKSYHFGVFETDETSWSPYSNICPISGFTGCNVARTGKNLFPQAQVSLGGDNPRTAIVYFPTLLPAGTYKMSYTFSGTYTGLSSSRGVNAYLAGTPNKQTGYVKSTGILTTSAPTSYLYFYFSTTNFNNGETCIFSDIQLEVDSTETPYEPYQGSTYHVSFSSAGTVYGCTLTLNQTTGTLTVDRVSVDMGTLNWQASATEVAGKNRFIVGISDIKSQTTNFICSQYIRVSSTYTATQTGCAVSAKNLFVYDERYAESDEVTFKTAMSGVQFVYELAEPITYTLTPTEITTLLGTNNIWSDTGDTSVTYVVETKMNAEAAKAAASVRRITGRTIRWRQRFRNDTTSHLSTANATVTLTDGVFRLASNTDGSAAKTAGFAVTRGHIYACSAEIRTDGHSETVPYVPTLFRSSGSSVVSGVIAENASDSWKLYRGFVTAPSAETSYFLLRLRNNVPSGYWAEYRNVMLFDLTEMYGEGHEPSEELFWSTFPAEYYTYSAVPSLVHTNVSGIRSVGFNAFDPDAGVARVLGGKEYEILGTYSSLGFSRTEDGTPEPVEPVNGIFTPSVDGYLTATGTGADFCVHLVWEGTRNGETEEYSVSEISLPVAEYFEGGMAGLYVGSTLYADELTPGKAIRRIAKRTLDGSESWGSINGGSGGAKYWRFVVTDFNPVEGAILSDRFPYAGIASTNTDIGVRAFVSSGTKYIAVRPSNYADLADDQAFRAWLSENPIEVVYYVGDAKVTESEASFDTIYAISDFGTEQAMPVNAGPVPVTTELHVEIAYRRNLREKLERFPDAPDIAASFIVSCEGTNLRYLEANKRYVAIEDMSSAYSDDSGYKAGNYCIRNGDLYMAVTDISEPEAWNPEHWLRCTVGERLESLQQAVGIIRSLEKHRGLTPSDLQKIAESGHADRFFGIGDVIYIPWTDNTPATPVTYQYPFAVGTFRDVYDDNGVLHKNAVGLQAVYATPQVIQFDAPEIVVAQQGETFTEGVYYYTKSGSDYTQATVTYGETVPASPVYYKHRFSGTYGASVIRYGYNRYSQSAYRQWLNSGSPKGTSWWAAQHDYDVAPEGHNTIPGFMDGFTSEWKAIFKPVRVQTLTNTVTDNGVTDTTYDKFFLPSLAEAYGSQTNAETEGAYWEYWKRETGYDSPTNGSSTDLNDARKIPAVYTDTPGAAVSCRLRSAHRSNANDTYVVYASGYISTSHSSTALRALPACFIY